MKTKLIALIGTLALVVPLGALAASVSLSPTTASVHAGDTFSVAVTANPASLKIYSVRANISFDSSKVTITGFTFAGTWIPVSQSGYDSIDNVGGVLIKTAGYPGGISAPMRLGTITFKAIKTGNVTISASGDSLLLDDASKNQISGSQGSVAVSITAAPVVVTPKSTPIAKTKTASVATTITTTPTEASTPTIVATSSLLAAVDSAITLGTNSPIVSALAAAAIVLAIVWGISFVKRRQF